MFSKAKRFDYYPKPDENPSPTCGRCLRKQTRTTHHNRSCTKTPTTSKKKITERSQNSVSSDDGFVDHRKNSVVSTDHDFSSNPSSGLSRTSSLSLFDHDQIFEVQVTDLDETIYNSVLEVSDTPNSLPSSKPIKGEVLRYLDEMEKRIDDQRQKIVTLRQQLFSSSGDNGSDLSRSASPSDSNLEDRLKHLEDASRSCVKETLDFITMYNKNLEAKCTSRPQDYKDLVEFCSELIMEVSSKISNDKSGKKKWKKLKCFFVNPFKKVFRGK